MITNNMPTITARNWQIPNSRLRRPLLHAVPPHEPAQRFGTDKDEGRAEKSSLSVPNLWGLFPAVQGFNARSLGSGNSLPSDPSSVAALRRVDGERVSDLSSVASAKVEGRVRGWSSLSGN